MFYTKLRVACAISELDTVTAILGMIDNYLEIEDTSDIEETIVPQYGELIDDSILRSDRTRGAAAVYVTAEEAEPSYAFIKERLKAIGLPLEIERSVVDTEVFENEWKKYYVPIHIGEHLTVVPRWQDYFPSDGEIVVRMDPGMAFGSGSHETTRLCLSLLERYVTASDTVLDIGTGSGILALFCSKLGAKTVFGCDIDPIAVAVARDNAAENEVTNAAFGQSDLLFSVPRKNYTIIAANIVSDIIVRLAPTLPAYMENGAKAIFSGIIAAREDEIRAAMTNAGLLFVEAFRENDWSAVVFKKRENIASEQTF